MLWPVQKQNGADFGRFIFEARQKRGWSLRTAAEATGIAYTRLDEIEKGTNWHTGKAARPRLEQVLDLARVYGLPEDELLVRAGFAPLIEASAEERELIAIFRRLPDATRREALDTLKALEEQTAD